MPRFYLPVDQCRNAVISLHDREAHHALHVLRIRQSDSVTILDGAGTEITGEVEACERHEVRLRVTQRKAHAPPDHTVTLVQAVPRGKMFDSVIQKATELGVARIIPLLSERVATRLDNEEAAQKSEKWQTVAIESIKQCGAVWLPKVEPPLTPAAYLARRENHELALIASLQPGAIHTREHFFAFQSKHRRKPKSVVVWVGPEGDFTGAEISAARRAGVLPITLGDLVLRVETAATYCMAIVQHELHSNRP